MPKVILITGASSGFGAACARKFAHPDHALILAARRRDRLKALAAELKENGPCHIAVLDVRQPDSIARFFEKLPARFRKIDVLVNNAGLALGLKPAADCDIGDWETMVDTNIKGLMRVTREVLPGMVARNNGHIVNIGSVAGTWPYPGGNVYGASKAFVRQFSRGLRADVLGKRIRVTHIDPGLAETEFSIVRMKGDGNKAKQVYEGTQPLRAEDIADIVHWVTSVPSHVNINAVEVMPICQAWGPLAVDRTSRLP